MKVRVAFVGAGGIANAHLSALHTFEEVELAAICDVNPEQAAKVSAQYGATPYTDFDTMLEKENFSVLFVCVPPFAHGDIEEKAIARGIHLFVEKPLGLDMEAIRRKEQLIRKAGIISSSGYMMRYQDITERAKQYLQDKKIAMVRGYYSARFVKAPWWRKIELSGGQLVEQTTHIVDLMRYLAGDVTKVYANMAKLATDDFEGSDVPDVGLANLLFQSGAIGNIENNCIQFERRYGVEIIGRDYRLFIDSKSLTIYESGQTVTYQAKSDSFKDQDLTFIRAVMNNDSSLVLSPYHDAMKTVELTLAANESAKTGAPVYL